MITKALSALLVVRKCCVLPSTPFSSHCAVCCDQAGDKIQGTTHEWDQPYQTAPLGDLLLHVRKHNAEG